MGDGNRRTNEGSEVSRAEIDTSAPFESVREAASRFGGIGFWKPSSHGKSPESSPESKELVDIEKLKEQTAQLENDILLKEQETLDVLKQLSSTKLVIDELKTKLQKENNTRIVANKNLDPAVEESDKENLFTNPNAVAPHRILMELKQAKLNITKFAHVRASVASLNDNLETEKALVEKTRERLTHNSSKVSYLEDELKQTELRLHLAKDGPQQLHRLSSEIEQFKKAGEAAHSEVQRTVSEIEKAKAQIKVAETRRVAAVKMKEAARATEAMARQEIKALSKNNSEHVTLTYEEYASLISKAEESETISNKRVVNAMLLVDEANMSKAEILKKVEEATEEVKRKKKVLEEAMSRVEAANRGKLAAEEALRNWTSIKRSRRRKRKSSATNFKTSSSSRPSLKQTLSIGQILSQKLQLAEEFESSRKVAAKYPLKRKKVSLRELLSKPNDDDKSETETHYQHQHVHQKQLSPKRKKFGFGRFSLLLAKQQKRKKILLCDLR